MDFQYSGDGEPISVYTEPQVKDKIVAEAVHWINQGINKAFAMHLDNCSFQLSEQSTPYIIDIAGKIDAFGYMVYRGHKRIMVDFTVENEATKNNR